MRTKSRGHAWRISAFLVVGGIGFVIDAGVFNALVYWGGRGPAFDAPLQAKIAAIAAATVATYFGNKWLTYRGRDTGRSPARFARFILINTFAIALQLGCLAIPRYLLGLADPVSDNLWGTLIGQAVAMVFRFLAYSKWVFPEAQVRAS